VENSGQHGAQDVFLHIWTSVAPLVDYMQYLDMLQQGQLNVFQQLDSLLSTGENNILNDFNACVGCRTNHNDAWGVMFMVPMDME